MTAPSFPAPETQSADSSGYEGREQRLWRRRQTLTVGLLVVWFVVTFGVSFFARELDGVIGGWPFSFWVAAQGALLVYVVLVLVFARQMGRLDDERDAGPGG